MPEDSKYMVLSTNLTAVISTPPILDHFVKQGFLLLLPFTKRYFFKEKKTETWQWVKDTQLAKVRTL